MTSQNYIRLARIVGNAFAATESESERTRLYENLYTPLVEYLSEDNPRFNQTRFAFAVANAESGISTES